MVESEKTNTTHRLETAALVSGYGGVTPSVVNNQRWQLYPTLLIVVMLIVIGIAIKIMTVS